MVNLPVFPDSTPQGFYERLLASKPLPDTGKPDPQKMAAFLDHHPETVAAMKIIKQSPPSAGFADSTFHGLNAFWFTNSAGATVPVRWSVVPQDAGGAECSGAIPWQGLSFRRPHPHGGTAAAEVAAGSHDW